MVDEATDLEHRVDWAPAKAKELLARQGEMEPLALHSARSAPLHPMMGAPLEAKRISALQVDMLRPPRSRFMVMRLRAKELRALLAQLLRPQCSQWMLRSLRAWTGLP